MVLNYMSTKPTTLSILDVRLQTAEHLSFVSSHYGGDPSILALRLHAKQGGMLVRGSSQQRHIQ